MIIFTDIDGTLFNNEHRAEFIPQDKSHTDNWRKFNELQIITHPHFGTDPVEVFAIRVN